MSRETFVDKCLSGTALMTDIDDFIDEWHDSSEDCELHEFLGFSWDEYSLLVERPGVLKVLLAAKKQGTDYKDLLQQSNSYAVAARSTADESDLIDWLKQTGRLPK